MKQLFRASVFVSVFILLANVSLPGQDAASKTAAPSRSETATTARKKQTAGPFYGKLAILDKSARSIKVGTRTFHVTPQTKIIRNEAPAKFEDGVVGEMASGYFTTAEDGRLVLKSLRYGKKTDRAKGETSASQNARGTAAKK